MGAGGPVRCLGETVTACASPGQPRKDRLTWLEVKGVRLIRREQAERSRELLLDAAAEEFWRHGLAGTRIQDILDRSGMTKGGLYHHFTSKQEMADALFAQEAERWPQLIEAVTGSQARGIALLQAFSLAVAERLGTQVRARAVLHITKEVEPTGAVTAFDLWYDFVILALQQAIADREIPDAIAIREVATMLVEVIYGVCTSPVPMSQQTDAAARIERLWTVLAPGLSAAGR